MIRVLRFTNNILLKKLKKYLDKKCVREKLISKNNVQIFLKCRHNGTFTKEVELTEGCYIVKDEDNDCLFVLDKSYFGDYMIRLGALQTFEWIPYPHNSYKRIK